MPLTSDELAVAIVDLNDSTKQLPTSASVAVPATQIGILAMGVTPASTASFLKTDINGNLLITGSLTLSSPALVGTGSASPATGSFTLGMDPGGLIRGIRTDTTGNLTITGSVAVLQPDGTATGTLGALNAAITIPLSGAQGAGFQLAAGTLSGTLVAEISYDGGTTWAATGFLDVDTKGLSDTISFTGGTNAAQTKGMQVHAGSGLLRVRVSAYISGTANGTLRVGQTFSPIVYNAPIDGRRATYSATALNFAPASLATDIFTISGSATKVVRVLRMEIYATQTVGSGNYTVQLIKRSAKNTGGTIANPTMVPYDSTNGAATATVINYTANPTGLGTSVGVIRGAKTYIPSVTSTGSWAPLLQWDFGSRPGQGIVLRGVNESLCVNLNTITVTGGSFTINTEWTEE